MFGGNFPQHLNHGDVKVTFCQLIIARHIEKRFRQNPTAAAQSLS